MPTPSAADLAARSVPPIVAIIQAAQPLPAARFTTMVVSAVTDLTGAVTGLTGAAIGTGPGGETYAAVCGETLPQVGETWRIAIAEGGQAFADDLVRVA